MTEAGAGFNDFSITYAREDRAWAEWIGQTLETEGYNVGLGLWNFSPGSNFGEEMLAAFMSSFYVLAIFSPKYLERLYHEQNWKARLSQRSRGSSGSGTIGIKVQPCDESNVLASSAVIDLVGKSETAAKELLIRRLQNRGIKPVSEKRETFTDDRVPYPTVIPTADTRFQPQPNDRPVLSVLKSTLLLSSELQEWIDTNGESLLAMSAENYESFVEERHRTMRILGMPRPVSLRSIYTRVNVLEKITAKHRSSIEDLERFFDRDRKHFGMVVETKDGMSVVNSSQKSIILGKPGAGKTTFLRYITLQAIDGRLIEKRIPVFISLKEWSDSAKPSASIWRHISVCVNSLTKPSW
jgi:hypothetical protein